MSVIKDDIIEEMRKRGEVWSDLIMANVSHQIGSWCDEEDLSKLDNASFDDGVGDSFMIWTKNYVYFPIYTDLGNTVSSVPRDPIENYVQTPCYNDGQTYNIKYKKGLYLVLGEYEYWSDYNVKMDGYLNNGYSKDSENRPKVILQNADVKGEVAKRGHDD